MFKKPDFKQIVEEQQAKEHEKSEKARSEEREYQNSYLFINKLDKRASCEFTVLRQISDSELIVEYQGSERKFDTYAHVRFTHELAKFSRRTKITTLAGVKAHIVWRTSNRSSTGYEWEAQFFLPKVTTDEPVSST